MNYKLLFKIIKTANALDIFEEYDAANCLTKIATKIAQMDLKDENSFSECDSLMYDPLMTRYKMMLEEDSNNIDQEIEQKLIIKINNCLFGTRLDGKGEYVLKDLLNDKYGTKYSTILENIE